MLKKLETTHTSLHIIAMFLMFLDHLWATLLPNYPILTCLGRIAFPIFAFLTVEGYRHTSDLKKYITRLFIFAVVSEIPFNLMYGSSVSYIYHQNVIWTLLLGVLMFVLLDKLNKPKLNFMFLQLVVIIIFTLVATVTMVDYYGTGILTLAIFYKFRERNPINILFTIFLIYYINTEILGGFYYDVTIFGYSFEVVQQSLATLALIPIFLYKGNKGNSPKWFKYFNYAFYPGHMLLLYIMYLILY